LAKSVLSTRSLFGGDHEMDEKGNSYSQFPAVIFIQKNRRTNEPTIYESRSVLYAQFVYISLYVSSSFSCLNIKIRDLKKKKKVA